MKYSYAKTMNMITTDTSNYFLLEYYVTTISDHKCTESKSTAAS